MKFNHKFRNMKWSDELVEYVEDRCQKLKKYELKPVNVSITFTAERYERLVEMQLNGSNFTIRAESKSDNFFESIDKGLAKLMKQMARKKSKQQSHKCIENSHYGKMSQLNDELEIAYPPIKKVG